MVELDWRVETRSGISLVELVVRNPSATAHRIRVANCLDGPVLPPRREGVPEAGWDDGGFEGVVGADVRRALGYATRAPPTEPPVELVWTERAGASEAERDADAIADDATPEGVVRALGDPRPPADAIPSGESAADAESSASSTADAESPVPEAVDSWLSGVEERAERENESSPTSEPAPEDRPALTAVARRIDALGDGRIGGSP